MSKKDIGLYNKFIVHRADGADRDGKKHFECDLFVLDITHDKFAIAAALAYAEACEKECPFLAVDLREKVAVALLSVLP